jgi:hypothetical protein
MLRETWAGFDRRATSALRALEAPNPIDQAIEVLIADAKAWVSAPGGSRVAGRG